MMVLLTFLLSACALLAEEPCQIQIVEKGSGWPVPMVQLTTTHNLRFVSDNNGLIACDAPELMERETWFTVLGHGYEVPKDGFGYAGVRLTPKPGSKIRVEVERKVIAKRLGRITGAGLLAESQKLGLERDWRESGIFGCDSVLTAVYRGRMFWAWGDTVLPHYPLGVFDTTSATTPIQPLKRFEPPVRLHYDYFTNGVGRPRAVAAFPGSGPTWLTAYVTLRDHSNQERLVATYNKIKPPLDAYESGLCLWNDATASFERIAVVWRKSEKSPTRPPLPEGHPSFWTDPEGKEWVLFGNPFPTLRCPAKYEGWRDQRQWEHLTSQTVLLSADGKEVKPHTGHIAWNSWRKKWVAVFMEQFGKPSDFGELWYAEAKSPLGPWGTAVKILSHQNYTFYNPRLHPEFTDPNSSVLLFEATYTAEFANRPVPTARYDYNQVLYRLDLDDPALRPAQQQISLPRATD